LKGSRGSRSILPLGVDRHIRARSSFWFDFGNPQPDLIVLPCRNIIPDGEKIILFSQIERSTLKPVGELKITTGAALPSAGMSETSVIVIQRCS